MNQINLEKINTYEAEKKYEEIFELLRKLEHETPFDAEVYYHYGCTYDGMGKEETAIIYYEKSLALGLSGENLRRAYIHLGSSYRCVGKYEKAKAVLQEGLLAFPEDEVLFTFLAMTEHNLQNHEKAMEILLQVLIHHTSSPRLLAYKRAISFYSSHLNEVFLEEK
jgi:tetratricopeptide (TPR) repeat protein